MPRTSSRADYNIYFRRGKPQISEKVHHNRTDTGDRVSGPSRRAQRRRVDVGGL